MLFTPVANFAVVDTSGNFTFVSQWPNLYTRVFVKTSPNRSYSVIENERFGLVFAKTGSIISGTGVIDTGGKFDADNNDTCGTGGKFTAGVVDTNDKFVNGVGTLTGEYKWP